MSTFMDVHSKIQHIIAISAHLNKVLYQQLIGNFKVKRVFDSISVKVLYKMDVSYLLPPAYDGPPPAVTTFQALG